MRPVVLVFLLAGCGRGGFEQHGRLHDADDALPDVPGLVIDADSDAGIDGAIDAAIDAPIDAIGTIEPICAGTTLDDLFDDGVAAPAFSATLDNGLTLLESAGHLDVQFAASVSSNNYAFYRSVTAYTTEGMCAAVEVSQVPAGVGAGYFKLRTTQLEAEFFANNGVLDLRTKTSGAPIVRMTLPINLGTNRFWRIRQLAGTTYWQTSSDGITYTTRMSLAGFFTAATAQVEIGGGAPATVTNAGIARYERALVIAP